MGIVMGVAAGVAAGLIAGVTMRYTYDAYIQERPMRRKLKSVYRKTLNRNKKCLII